MSNKNKKFIISVVPLTRIPLTRDQFFYYLYNKKLPNGSLVSILLGGRKIEGVVIGGKPDFKRKGDIRLKKINSMIEEKFLTPKQLKLAKFISDYYIVSLGIVLKSFIPNRVKARDTEHGTHSLDSLKRKKIILTKEQKKIIKQITKQAASCYLYGPASSGKTEVYINAVLEIKKRNPKAQFLILLPELTLIPQALEKYGSRFNKNEIAVLTGKISKGKFYRNWQRIKAGEAKIIIGTRQAIFAPFKNLKLIVVDEEPDISFKQWDMSPRYDARKSAEELAKIHRAKIVFGSAAPSIEAYYKALNKKYKLLKLPKLQNLKNKNSSKVTSYELRVTSYEIVDMRKEKWAKNYSPISKCLESEIKYALKHKFQTILFINRRGMSAFSVCQNCKTVLKCPKCDRALVYQNKGAYKCLHCGYESSIFPKCPKCQGINFKNIGLGTQKIEMETKKLFPSAKIARADIEAMKKAGAQEKLYRKFSKNRIDILIGTQMIAKNWDLQNVGLVGIIDADNLLNLPDFRTNERAFQNLVQVSGRTGRPGSKAPRRPDGHRNWRAGKVRGKVVIQTYDPENSVLKTAAEMDFEKFYRQELKERKVLNYPPFSQLIKIVFQNKNEEKTDKETRRIFRELSQKMKNKKTVQIIAPHPPLVPKVRGKFKRQIIIKIKSKPSTFPPEGKVLDKKIPAELKKILKNLNAGWIIDVDPVSVV